MGKKKHKKHGKHHDHAEAGGGPIPAPLAGIAAMATGQVVRQLQNPTTREAMACGLRAAADALSRSAAPTPPVPPVPPTSPVPPIAAAPGEPGTTKAPDPQAIAGAIEEAAKQVLGRLFAKRPS